MDGPGNTEGAASKGRRRHGGAAAHRSVGYRRPTPESSAVFILLTALVALGQISTSIYIPSMPSIVGALATDVAAVNLTMTVFLFGFAIAQLVYGPLSDRFGRRPVLLTGLALYVVASLVCVLASSIEALIIGRLLQGMTACAGPVLGRAVVRDVYGASGAARVMATIGAALAVSPAVAPLIGGGLQEGFGWRAAFWFLVAVGIVIGGATWALLRETAPPAAPDSLRLRSQARAWRTLIASPSYWGYTLAVGLTFAGLMAFTAGAPFVFIDVLGLSPAGFGALAIFNVSGFLTGSLVARRFTPRLGLDRLLRIGLCLSACGGTAMAAFGAFGWLSVTAVIGPMMVFTTGMGIVLANGIAGAMIPFPAIAGAASAVLGFVQMVVSGFASLAVGLFAPTSQLPMATVIGITALAALAAFSLLVPRRRTDPADVPDAPPPSARTAASAPADAPP